MRFHDNLKSFFSEIEMFLNFICKYKEPCILAIFKKKNKVKRAILTRSVEQNRDPISKPILLRSFDV